MPISISRSVTVCDGDSKPWVLHDVKIVGGIEFVAMRAADKAFCRFVQSKGVPARSHGNLQCGASAALGKMQALRTTATLQHVATHSAAFSSLFDDPLPTEKEKKRARKEASNQELPDFVEVTLPGFTNDHDALVEPLQVKMVPSIHLGSSLWVELSAPVLAFVKGSLRSALREDIAVRQAPCGCPEHHAERVSGGYVKWMG